MLHLGLVMRSNKTTEKHVSATTDGSPGCMSSFSHLTETTYTNIYRTTCCMTGWYRHFCLLKALACTPTTQDGKSSRSGNLGTSLSSTLGGCVEDTHCRKRHPERLDFSKVITSRLHSPSPLGAQTFITGCRQTNGLVHLCFLTDLPDCKYAGAYNTTIVNLCTLLGNW